MGVMTPRVTRTRVAGAITVFAVATVILLLAGLEMQSYLVGVVAGLAVFGLPAGTALWVQKRRTDSTNSE